MRVEQIVPYNSTKEDVDALYESVNGFIFPGGGSKITDAARHLYAKVVNASQDELVSREARGDRNRKKTSN